jgi:hypothetical protein
VPSSGKRRATTQGRKERIEQHKEEKRATQRKEPNDMRRKA